MEVAEIQSCHSMQLDIAWMDPRLRWDDLNTLSEHSNFPGFNQSQLPCHPGLAQLQP